MMTKREQGFTLLELLFSLAMFGVAGAAMTSGFMQLEQRNWEHEVKSAAIAAAQQVLDEMRLQDPTTLPSSGSTERTVAYGSRQFTVRTSYCTLASYCSTNIRQIRLGVSYLGKMRYQVDSVFCQLR